MILHVPHDSLVIPTRYRESFRLDDEALQQELLRMTDLHTKDLFGADADSNLVFPVSRLLVDVERFEDDAQESMAAQGMGVLYTRTHDQQPLRRALSPAEREELLDRYYRPHHARLQELVQAELDRQGCALLIDCHSFPSQRLPYEIGEEGERPEICIGTDTFHSPEPLSRAALDGFARRGYTVALNRPFAGAITPLAYYGKEPRVRSIMIEIRRDLYLDEETGERIPRFEEVRRHIREVLDELEPFNCGHGAPALPAEFREARFRCDRKELPPAFFIITAHNPDGETTDAAANQRADALLHAEIQGMGCEAFPVIGGSADFSHAEPGYGLPCSREEALDLARRFSQLAVFEVRDGVVHLVSALEHPVPDEEIGRWADLSEG